jgi:hypothetical protein
MNSLRKTLPLVCLIASLLISNRVATLEAQVVATDVTRLEVNPRQLTLENQLQRAQIVVTGYLANGEIADLTHSVDYQISEAKIATVSSSGVVTPSSDGATTIVVHFGNQQQDVNVTVSGQGQVEPISFAYHALPILAKAGCSGGACHGSPNGKAGFKLSLFATDPRIDQHSLIRSGLGRRTNTIDPDASLLLQKPTMQVAHQGGKRLDRNDQLYRLLRDWIGEGCRIEEGDATCTGIDVFPNDSRLLRHPNHTQQYRVTAKFSDGSQRDVTHLAMFDSSDENVVHVTPSGKAIATNRGEAAIIIRFLEFIRTPMLTYVRDIEGFEWNNPRQHNYIDVKVDEKLKQLQYVPSELCADEVFVRRVYLDVTGLLPTVEESTKFIQDESENKRGELIDELLDRPAYARFWAQKWGDLLRVSRKQIGMDSVFKYNRWLEFAVSSNMPYDKFARQMLTSSGSTRIQPSGNYYRTAGDTHDAMETTAQLFMGSRIQCAKCHNHPFERWTQDNYYGLAAVFSRIERKKTGRGDEVFVRAANTGDVRNPRTGQFAKPWVPVAGELEIAEKRDRRQVFVDWLVAAENPLFSRVEVNRIWAHTMGRGIVEPFDDFRDSNPPANAPLLDALAADFTKHNYDRKYILRTILNSRTYQSTTRTNDLNRDDFKYFSHYQPRRLTAEQMVDALGQVTGRPKQFEFVATGTKATWLPAPDLKPHNRSQLGQIEFLKVFGQPERSSACECERGDDSSLGQALELLNGKFIQEMLAHPETKFRKALATGKGHDEVIADLYRAALSRSPSAAELKVAIQYIDGSDNKQQALEDVCWAIFNKDEFLFQH